jgi:Ribonuclease G/E
MADAAPDTILMSRGPGETRYALLSGEDVVELAFARDGAISTGMVVAGRISGFLGGAMFVDIGDTVPGVLRAKPRLHEGVHVAVRVTVPQRAGKGAELKLTDGTTVPSGTKAGAVLAPAPDPAQQWWDRHGGTVTRIVCAPASELRRLRAVLGAAAPIQAHTAASDLFADFGIDDAIEAALAPTVALPCGGALRIEATAGAVVIDVDAGPADPKIANVEAVHAAARALRLRNLAGHILVDVIPPTGKRGVIRAAAKVLADHLAALTVFDPAGVDVAGVTPLGMLELTRRRLGLSLAETLVADARGTATEAYAALRRAVRAAHQAKTARVVIGADAAVAALLQGGLQGAVREAEDIAKVEIAVHIHAKAGVDVRPG